MIVHARVLDYKLHDTMHSYSAFFSIQTLYLTFIAVLNHQLNSFFTSHCPICFLVGPPQ